MNTSITATAKYIPEKILSNFDLEKIVDTTDKSFVFELTGAMDKINSFIDLLRPLGLNDISRTGLAAIARGSKN